MRTRHILGFIAGLVVAVAGLLDVAHAQYGPPGNPSIGSSLAFQPLAYSAALNASTTSANIALAATSGNTTTQVQVYNTTTGIAFVRFCPSSTCVASVGSTGTSTSDYPVAPGSVVVVTVPLGVTYGAAVLSTSTGVVYLTLGVGL